MKLELDTATLVLPAGRMVKLRAGRGTRLRCLAGTLWVTQEGLPEDAFLTTGQGVVVRSRALTIIEALGGATLWVAGALPRPGDAGVREMWKRWIPYY